MESNWFKLTAISFQQYDVHSRKCVNEIRKYEMHSNVNYWPHLIIFVHYAEYLTVLFNKNTLSIKVGCSLLFIVNLTHQNIDKKEFLSKYLNPILLSSLLNFNVRSLISVTCWILFTFDYNNDDESCRWRASDINRKLFPFDDDDDEDTWQMNYAVWINEVAHVWTGVGIKSTNMILKELTELK